MAGETTICVVGTLTADPELRYTQSGLPVVNFTIASNDRKFDKDTNDWKDGDALFLRASCWREFAEHVAGSLTKGTRVIAQGHLKQRGYETKEGEKRTSMELEILAIGPELRYATAAVTKIRKSDPSQTVGEPWTGDPNETWPPAASAPAGGQVRTPAAASGGGDVWNQPGSYTDETPF